MANEKIKILVVDDSRTESLLLKSLLNSEQDMEVIACAKNGKEAIDMLVDLKPDIITMDLQMPIMDGLTATKFIMSHFPVPIVIISSKLSDTKLDMTYLALEAGAVSVVKKPVATIDTKKFDRAKKIIIDTVRSMAEIKVIKRRFNIIPSKPDSSKSFSAKAVLTATKRYEILAIGTSVGGPQALKTIFSKLAETFPLPIVVVQHMTPGFIEGFTKWLNNNTPLTVKIAENHELLKKGFIYFAPDNHHLTVMRSLHGLTTILLKGKPVSGFCPSITVLLQSVTQVCNDKAIGVLLTGMGNDGAEGLLEMKKANAHTIVQDEKSCIVYGIGGVAHALGAVDQVVKIDEIAEYLVKITNEKNK